MIKSSSTYIQGNDSPSLQSSSSANKLNSNLQSINVDTIQEGKLQTLSNISQLQGIEKEYFNKLEQGATQDNISQPDKDAMIQKINELSQMRITLYKNLNGMNEFGQVAYTRDTLSEQSSAIDIVENELNESKRRLKSVEEDRTNKLRLVEINTYYGERYNDHTLIMKIIILTCIPVLILTLFKNAGFIPLNIYIICIIITLSIGVIFLGYHLYYTLYRDNMNYQEYDWWFDSSKAPDVNTDVVTKDPWSVTGKSVCFGQDCCAPDQVYNSDPSVNKCIPISSTTS